MTPHVPGTFRGNGDGGPNVPDNIEWDENNPPVIFNCSTHIRHMPGCDGNCGEPTTLVSELQVELINESRKWIKAGMAWQGVPSAYQGKIPITGISIELVDLLMWLQTVKDYLTEQFGIDKEEFDERYRKNKLELLRAVREANEEEVRQNRLRQQMMVAQKPGLLGPNGEPI